MSGDHQEDVDGEDPGGHVDHHGGKVESEDGQQDVHLDEDECENEDEDEIEMKVEVEMKMKMEMEMKVTEKMETKLNVKTASRMFTRPRTNQMPLQIIQGFIKLALF